MATPRRAAVYVRLSRDHESSLSVEGQLTNCRRWCADNGVTVAHEFVDAGLSGGKERANVAEALRLLRSHEVDVLVVDKVDRFGRQGLKDAVSLLDVLEATPSALVVAVSEGLRSDSPTWSLHMGMLAVMGRAELDRITQRNSAKMARLREARRWRGSPAPFGYRTAKVDGGKVLVIAEDEASRVREWASRVLEGASIYSLVAELNSEGFPSPAYHRALTDGREPKGSPLWTVDKMRRLLTSPALRGYMVVDRYDVVRDDDGVPVEVFPPILTEAEHLRLRALYGADERTARARARRDGQEVPPPPNSPTFKATRLLSSLLHCGRCGATMHLMKATGPNGSRVVIYSCSRARVKACKGTTIVADNVEAYVSEVFLAARGDLPVLAPVAVDSVATVRLAQLHAAIEDAARSMATSYSPEVADRLQRLHAEREELEASPSTPTVEWTPTGQTYRERWASLDTDGRRDMLKAALSIRVAPPPRRKAPVEDRVHILWRPVPVVGITDAGRSPLATFVLPPDDPAAWDHITEADVVE